VCSTRTGAGLAVTAMDTQHPRYGGGRVEGPRPQSINSPTVAHSPVGREGAVDPGTR
jgi:hypothetical protein